MRQLKSGILALAASLLLLHLDTTSGSAVRNRRNAAQAATLIGTLDPDDIPLAFRDSGTLTRRDAQPEEQNCGSAEKAHKPCTNGSGGLCVPSGKCPADAKGPASGCPAKHECCFSVPNDEENCSRLGGECVDKNLNCKSTPNRKTNCDAAGKTCCILLVR